MIDLHFHLLPGIDDGPADLSDALALATHAAASGITVIACTPHIMPGVYDNEGADIRSAVAALRRALDEKQIPVRLVAGADNHLVPDLVGRLRSGRALSIADTRYVLVEPPHHVLPPRVDRAFFDLVASGYVPILTHPERMGWIERGYPMVGKLAREGVLMQVTAASFTGGFGSRARYWSERMLDDGVIGLVATDAHDVKRRPPALAQAFEAVSKRVGEERSRRLFLDAPRAILDDAPPAVHGERDVFGEGAAGRTGVARWFDRLLGRAPA